MTVLNRFLSRDPLPPDGQTDILYGDDWVTRNIAMRMKPYNYVDNNSPNRVSPSALASIDDTSLRFRLPTPLVVALLANQEGTLSDFGEDVVAPPVEDCAVALPAPKPACERVRAPHAVQTDTLGNVTCKQVVAGVFLWLKYETKTVNGTPTFVPMCYGCIDHSCKTDKMPKKKCGIAPLKVPPDVRYECKCVGPDK